MATQDSSQETEGYWCVESGEVVRREPSQPFDEQGTVRLTYSNPFNLKVERVWFDQKVVFAIEQGELDVPLSSVKLAQEYQVVYSVDLDEDGKLLREPERVEGQYNIYDSVPGMEKYSPLWQFNYGIVPRDYVPQSLRSEQDCLASGYEIRQSTVIEN